MYREDNTYQPILSEPVMSQKKRTKKQIYLEVLERHRKRTPTKVTEDDIIAYDYWCDHIAGDETGYASAPMPPWLIEFGWKDEKEQPHTWVATMKDGTQKLMTGVALWHVKEQDKNVMSAEEISHKDYHNDKFLDNLKKEISENNEKIGRPNNKKKL